MNVLIVDDDKLARKGLIAVIDWEQYGLCVVGDVQNGKKALEFLENHPVDLVFTDIDMPEMNGLELMKICKESYPETDFVIFSVYEDFSFARQALRLGALDYISKIEFDPEECDAIMKKIVETYQNKRREKAERNLRTEEQLYDVKRVAIAGHVKPDGDCVGSTLAVYNYIRKYHPEMEVELHLEPIPNIFKFLANADKIDSSYIEKEPYDLFIALDCGDEKRLGNAVKYFHAAKRTFCVDHHISNQNFADANYIFPEASSTCELVYELIDEEKITKEIAECIYVGIVHDTGVFQYSCTSAKTMNIAGRLMEMGIDFSRIVDKTYYEKTYEQNRILGQALVDSQLFLDGKCIASIVTKEEMEKYQVLPKHLEGIVQQLRATKDVEAAIFLYENEDGSFKASMRSSGKVDVAVIMMSYGGGGHIRAAGATIEGNAKEILEGIVKDVEKQLLK